MTYCSTAYNSIAPHKLHRLGATIRSMSIRQDRDQLFYEDFKHFLYLAAFDSSTLSNIGDLNKVKKQVREAHRQGGLSADISA
jgi:hypothetical protein